MTPATFTRRLAAAALDILIVMLVVGTVWSLVTRMIDPEIVDAALEHRRGNAMALITLTTIVYVLYCWVRLQGTPGKLLMRCRIVDARNGAPPRPGQAVIRLAGYLLSALPLGLGFLWIIRDARRRGWHDRLAGTEVVMDDESTSTLEQLAHELREGRCK